MNDYGKLHVSLKKLCRSHINGTLEIEINKLLILVKVKIILG